MTADDLILAGFFVAGIAIAAPVALWCWAASKPYVPPIRLKVRKTVRKGHRITYHIRRV